MDQFLSKSAFAASQGWRPSYVTKLLHQKRLVLAPDGKRVDVAATLQLIGRTADPAKEGVVEHHHQQRAQRDVYMPLRAEGSSEPSDYQRHKTEREKHLAGIARIEFDRLSGNTVERGPVSKAAFAAGRLVRDSIFALNRQLAPELATMTDPWAIERFLNGRHRGMLTEVGRIAQDDLDALIDIEEGE
jgi:hypothetical protein